MKPFKPLILFLGLLISVVPMNSQTNTENPAAIVMQKVIQKMIANEALKNKYLNFKKHYLDMKLDSSGKSKKKPTTDQVFEVKPPNGDEVLIQEDGESKNEKQDQNGNKDFERIIEALSLRFDYELAKPTVDCPTCPLTSKDGKAYLIINFRANNQVGTGGDDVKEVMNRSEGKLYVDVENLYIQRFESNMTRPYNRVGGVFQLKQANMIFEQSEIDTPEGKIIVAKPTDDANPAITIQYRYRIVIFGETRGIRSWTYEDYRYIP